MDKSIEGTDRNECTSVSEVWLSQCRFSRSSPSFIKVLLDMSFTVSSAITRFLPSCETWNYRRWRNRNRDRS